MQEQIVEPISSPAVAPVKLWTPGFIAGVSFFLGFPAGIVLAAINWIRMRMNNKAIAHLIGGAVGLLIFVLLLIFTPSSAGRWIALVFNLGALFYLQQQMKKDLEAFQLTTRVEKAGELGGCLIGLGIFVVFLVFVFVLAFGLALLGVPMPE